MSRTTGPILAMGAVTVSNEVVLNGKPMDWRIPVGTAVAIGMFSLAEKVSPDIASGVAWIAFATVLFVRLKRDAPSPVENFLEWTK